MHPAFELVLKGRLAELDADFAHFRHIKTGCEVFHLLNDDPENLFAFAFRTPATDSTGVTHILEHSVLCGSENYPLKDAFMTLSKKSVNTFLNAFTYPDKTVYPGSSIIKADYFNLMSVYGDAVFFPRLTPEIFMQEGRRFAPDEAGKPGIQGVVFNEMKGAYSDPDNFAGRAMLQALFPGHTYANDSGGDPARIPDLTYESFMERYRAFYSPANCRVFLCGDIPSDEQLAFLDGHFLSKLERRDVDTRVAVPERLEQARVVDAPFPAEDESSGKNLVFMNWYIGTVLDPADTVSFVVLARALMGHDGAPLSKALMDSGLGEDLAPQNGLELDILASVFSAGLRGVKLEDREKVEDVVMAELSRISREGFDPADIDAAIKGSDFENREIKRSHGGPYSLRLMERSLRGWLYGESPERTLGVIAAMEEVKRRRAADPRYFEKLLESVLVANAHRVTMAVHPSRAEFDLLEKAIGDALRARVDASGRIAIPGNDDALARLKDFQERDESELERLIPMVDVAEMPREVESIPRETSTILGRPLLWHPMHTNGIAYLDLAFSLDGLEADELYWLSLFAHVLPGSGYTGKPYHEVQRMLALATGGFHAHVQTGVPLGSKDGKSVNYLVFRVKALESDFPEALDLVSRIVIDADFSDRDRLADQFKELSNAMASDIVPSGTSYMRLRVQAPLSDGCAADERLRGLSQYRFLRALEGDPGYRELGAALSRLRGSVIALSGLTVNLTGSPGFIDAAKGALEGFARSLAPARVAAGLPRIPVADADPHPVEVWQANAQVGYSCAAMKAFRFPEPGYAQERAVAKLLSSGAFWNEIRMKNGAYGAWAMENGINATFACASYRDPDPSLSAASWESIMRTFAEAGISHADADAGIIGVMGDELAPMTPETRGHEDFRRYLYGVTDGMRQAERDALLATGKDDLDRTAGSLVAGFAGARFALIAGKEAVAKARERFPGAVVRELGV